MNDEANDDSEPSPGPWRWENWDDMNHTIRLMDAENQSILRIPTNGGQSRLPSETDRALIASAPDLRAQLAAAEARAEKAQAEVERLERELTRALEQRDQREEQVGDMAAQAGCGEEFSNLHDHRNCVGEAFGAMDGECERLRAREKELEAMYRREYDKPANPEAIEAARSEAPVTSVERGLLEAAVASQWAARSAASAEKTEGTAGAPSSGWESFRESARRLDAWVESSRADFTRLWAEKERAWLLECASREEIERLKAELETNRANWSDSYTKVVAEMQERGEKLMAANAEVERLRARTEELGQRWVCTCGDGREPKRCFEHPEKYWSRVETSVEELLDERDAVRAELDAARSEARRQGLIDGARWFKNQVEDSAPELDCTLEMSRRISPERAADEAGTGDQAKL